MKDERRCTAKSKRSQERCRKAALIDRSVCRTHGGKTPRGLASPQFKHGRYSKSLPHDLLENFELSLSDPELLETSREISLLDARISQLLRSISDGQSVAAWDAAVYAWRAYKRSLVKRDHQAEEDAFSRLENILEKESEKHRGWQEIQDLVALRRKLSDSQTKREMVLGRFVEVSKVNVLLAALTNVIKSEVRDIPTKRNIALRFDKILGNLAASETLDLPPVPSFPVVQEVPRPSATSETVGS